MVSNFQKVRYQPAQNRNYIDERKELGDWRQAIVLVKKIMER